MSYFDPHGIYFHPQRFSHKGQIITKKPGNGEFAYSEEDFKKAIHIVKDILHMGIYQYPLPLYRRTREVYTLNLNLNFLYSPSQNSTFFPFSSLMKEFRRFRGNDFKKDFIGYDPANATLSFHLLSFSGWFSTNRGGYNVFIDTSNLQRNLTYSNNAVDSLFFVTYSGEDAICYYLVDDNSTTTDPGVYSSDLIDAYHYISINELETFDEIKSLATDPTWEPTHTEDIVVSLSYKDSSSQLIDFNSVCWLTFIVVFECVVSMENLFLTQNDITIMS